MAAMEQKNSMQSSFQRGQTQQASKADLALQASKTQSTKLAMDVYRTYDPSAGILTNIVRSRYFDEVMLGVIFLNCITMGIEAENLLGRSEALKPAMAYSEHVFTALFTLELSAKIVVFGYRLFLPHVSVWNFLDLVLVFVTGILAVWILPILGEKGGASFRVMSTLRAMRMFRLVRILRGSLLFKDVWLLLQGLLESSRTLMWTIAVIFFITYMFAVFGVVLISTRLQDDFENDRGDSELSGLLDYVDGLGMFMLLLIQVLTLDSWTGVVRPMMDYINWVWVFFLLYIAVAVLVLMNLVTAVIVENALEASKKNEKMQYKEIQKRKTQAREKLKSLFSEIDINGNGLLTYSEFLGSFDHKDIGPKLQLLGLHKNECEEIFHLLDVEAEDGSEPTISIDEFLTNFQRIQGQAQARDMFYVLRQQTTMLKAVTGLQEKLIDFIGGDNGSRTSPSTPQAGNTMFAYAGSSQPFFSPALRAASSQVETNMAFTYAVPAEKSAQERAAQQANARGETTKVSSQLDEVLVNLQDIQFKTSISAQKMEGLSCEITNFHRMIDMRLARTFEDLDHRMEVYHSSYSSPVQSRVNSRGPMTPVGQLAPAGGTPLRPTDGKEMTNCFTLTR